MKTIQENKEYRKHYIYIKASGGKFYSFLCLDISFEKQLKWKQQITHFFIISDLYALICFI